MSKYKVNEAAIEKASSLIGSNQYVLDSDWSESQPSPDDENEYQQRHGWEDLGQWYLAIDTDASEETKDRYGFVYGDFRRVHRSGLIAAKQRAAQNGHTSIQNSADKLLEQLDASQQNE